MKNNRSNGAERKVSRNLYDFESVLNTSSTVRRTSDRGGTSFRDAAAQRTSAKNVRNRRPDGHEKGRRLPAKK